MVLPMQADNSVLTGEGYGKDTPRYYMDQTGGEPAPPRAKWPETLKKYVAKE